MDYDGNRSWMYNRVYENMGLRQTFVDGVGHFIDKAKLLPEYLTEGKIKCPCAKCKCSDVQRTDAVVRHLFRKGFMPNYFVWTAHGEFIPSVGGSNNKNEYSTVSGAYDGYNYPMHEMINDAFGMYQGEPSQPAVEELPNNEAKLFYEQLEEASRPFYEGATHSKLSVAVRLLSIKSDYNISQGGMDEIIGLRKITKLITTNGLKAKDQGSQKTLQNPPLKKRLQCLLRRLAATLAKADYTGMVQHVTRSPPAQVLLMLYVLLHWRHTLLILRWKINSKKWRKD